MCIGLHVKSPLVSSDFNKTFLDIFSKNTHISNHANNRPVGADLFHADTQTDIPKVKVAFRNFANAPVYYLTALH